MCFHLSEIPKVVKFRKSRAGAGEGGNEELLFDGYGVSVLQDKKSLEIGGTTLRMYLTLVNLKMIKVVSIMYLKPIKQSLGLCVIVLILYVYFTTIFF